MVKVWLPIPPKPRTNEFNIVEPTTGREMLLIVPGASRMDRSELEEIIGYEREKTLAQLKAKGPVVKSRFSKKEIGGALREFNEYLRAKEHNAGYKKFF